MPRRILHYSRTEPARTILVVLAIVTALLQMLTLTPWIEPPVPFLEALPNFVIVAGLCGWGAWSGLKNNIKQMAMSSFWLFAMWLWGAVVRILVGLPAIDLRFAGFLTTALCLGVVYLYLSHQRRDSERPVRIGDLD